MGASFVPEGGYFPTPYATSTVIAPVTTGWKITGTSTTGGYVIPATFTWVEPQNSQWFWITTDDVFGDATDEGWENAPAC